MQADVQYSTPQAARETQRGDNGEGAKVGTSRVGFTFLYVLEAGPFCKVGITHNLTNRLQTYATHCPLPFSCALVVEMKTQFARGLERAVHKQLESRKQRGEWFNVSAAEAIQALEAAKKEGVPAGRGRAYPLTWPILGTG